MRPWAPSDAVGLPCLKCRCDGPWLREPVPREGLPLAEARPAILGRAPNPWRVREQVPLEGRARAGHGPKPVLAWRRCRGSGPSNSWMGYAMHELRLQRLERCAAGVGRSAPVPPSSAIELNRVIEVQAESIALRCVAALGEAIRSSPRPASGRGPAVLAPGAVERLARSGQAGEGAARRGSDLEGGVGPATLIRAADAGGRAGEEAAAR